MALNNAGMLVPAEAMQTAYAYAQLHSAAAGGSGTSNVTSAARVATAWSAITGAGDFDLDVPLEFTGGTPGGAVYSVTLWSASTSGTFYGEFPLTGDSTFNASGEYSVSSISLDGSAS